MGESSRTSSLSRCMRLSGGIDTYCYAASGVSEREDVREVVTIRQVWRE